MRVEHEHRKGSLCYRLSLFGIHCNTGQPLNQNPLCHRMALLWFGLEYLSSVFVISGTSVILLSPFYEPIQWEGSCTNLRTVSLTRNKEHVECQQYFIHSYRSVKGDKKAVCRIQLGKHVIYSSSVPLCCLSCNITIAMGPWLPGLKLVSLPAFREPNPSPSV